MRTHHPGWRRGPVRSLAGPAQRPVIFAPNLPAALHLMGPGRLTARTFEKAALHNVNHGRSQNHDENRRKDE